MKNKNVFVALLIFVLFIGAIIFFGIQSKNNKEKEWSQWQEDIEKIDKAGENLDFSNKVASGQNPLDESVDLSDNQNNDVHDIAHDNKK